MQQLDSRDVLLRGMASTGSEVGQGLKKSAQKNKYFEERADSCLNPLEVTPTCIRK